MKMNSDQFTELINDTLCKTRVAPNDLDVLAKQFAALSKRTRQASWRKLLDRWEQLPILRLAPLMLKLMPQLNWRNPSWAEDIRKRYLDMPFLGKDGCNQARQLLQSLQQQELA